MKASLFGVLAALLSQTVLSAQTTNTIPPNLFLTDDGKIFWYESTGERVIHTSTIKQAQESKESRPVDKDPEGNWGIATNGFQLSLRFEKPTFTNGESIVATMLMRNVSGQSQTYFRPTGILATKDGAQLHLKYDTDRITITMSPETSLYPQTQHKYQVDLTQEYDLSGNGAYSFQATCRRSTVFSKPVSIWVTNIVTQ